MAFFFWPLCVCTVGPLVAGLPTAAVAYVFKLLEVPCCALRRVATVCVCEIRAKSRMSARIYVYPMLRTWCEQSKIDDMLFVWPRLHMMPTLGVCLYCRSGRVQP